MTSGLPRRKQYGIEHSPVFICDHESLRNLSPTAFDRLSQKFTGGPRGKKIEPSHGDLVVGPGPQI
jgi:hypothetical protein